MPERRIIVRGVRGRLGKRYTYSKRASVRHSGTQHTVRHETKKRAVNPAASGAITTSIRSGNGRSHEVIRHKKPRHNKR